MTLQQFITLTTGTPNLNLRRAMALALATEVPRTPGAYARFRHRVAKTLRREQRERHSGIRKQGSLELTEFFRHERGIDRTRARSRQIARPL